MPLQHYHAFAQYIFSRLYSCSPQLLLQGPHVLKMMISAREWCVKQPFTGQNTQHALYFGALHKLPFSNLLRNAYIIKKISSQFQQTILAFFLKFRHFGDQNFLFGLLKKFLKPRAKVLNMLVRGVVVLWAYSSISPLQRQR